jgi:hypothetical protein
MDASDDPSELVLALIDTWGDALWAWWLGISLVRQLIGQATKYP